MNGPTPSPDGPHPNPSPEAGEGSAYGRAVPHLHRHSKRRSQTESRKTSFEAARNPHCRGSHLPRDGQHASIELDRALLGHRRRHDLQPHGLRCRPLAVDEVGVWKVAGRECWEAWPLADVYTEAWAERHPEAGDGSAMRTGSLFSEPVEADENRETDKDTGFATPRRG